MNANNISNVSAAAAAANCIGYVVYTLLADGASIDHSDLQFALRNEGLPDNIGCGSAYKALRFATSGRWMTGLGTREVVFRPLTEEPLTMAALLLEKRDKVFELGQIGVIGASDAEGLSWEQAPDAPGGNDWGQVMKLIMERFYSHWGRSSAGDINSYYKSLMAGRHPVHLKNGSGVHFVPVIKDESGADGGAAPKLMAFNRALERCGGGGVHAMPVYGADQGTQSSVRSAAKSEIAASLDALEAELAAGLSGRKASNRLDVLAELLERAELYRDLVAFSLEDVEARFSAAKAAFAEAVQLDVKPEKQRRSASSELKGFEAEAARLKEELGSGAALKRAVRELVLASGGALVGGDGGGAEEAEEAEAEAPVVTEEEAAPVVTADEAEGAPEPQSAWTADRLKAVARKAKVSEDGRATEDGLSIRFDGGVYRWEVSGEEGTARSMNALVADILAL